MRAKIKESSVILPEIKVLNSKLEELFELKEGYIESSAGIKERGVFSPEYTVGRVYLDLLDMLAQKSGISRFDSIILGTDYIERDIDLPSNIIYTKISNCPGSVSAIIKESKRIERGEIKNSLILAASRLCDLVSKLDIGSSVLWGDGAAGILLERSEDESGFIHYKEHKDISLDCLGVVTVNGQTYCRMNGRGVTSYVLRNIPDMITQCLDEVNMKPTNIDYFIFHQANGRLLDALVKILKIPQEKVQINVDINGNTGIASSLITYNQLRESGKLEQGMHYLFAAFGLGEDGKGMQSDVAIFRE